MADTSNSRAVESSRALSSAFSSGWAQSTARIATGVTLPYIERGKRDGTPVVLLHGFTDSCRSFEPILGHLPESLRVFALSQRGHGDADRPAAGYRLEDFARDLAAFLDAVQIDSAVIVGHSMSTAIAQRFAIDYPQRARALVLEGAFFDFANNASARELVAEVARLEDPVDPQFARAFQESTITLPVAPEFLDMVVEESLKLPARVWKAVLDGLFAGDLSAERSRITQPTLLIWGAADTFVPRDDQQQFLRAIAGSMLREYSAAGHAVHWEEPARFAADLAAFVDRL